MYLSIPEVGSYVIGTVAELNREDFMHFRFGQLLDMQWSGSRLRPGVSPYEPFMLSRTFEESHGDSTIVGFGWGDPSKIISFHRWEPNFQVAHVT